MLHLKIMQYGQYTLKSGNLVYQKTSTLLEFFPFGSFSEFTEFSEKKLPQYLSWSYKTGKRKTAFITTSNTSYVLHNFIFVVFSESIQIGKT